MTRAIGYTRISKADRRQGQDPEASMRQQRAAITRYCQEHGWDLVTIYEDFAISGATEDRDSYLAALAALDAREADVLVVRHLDRLSREADVLLGLLSGERRWVIAAVQQDLDTGTASGWFAAGMFALVAEYERRLLSERTRQALAQLRREGKHLGRPSAIPADVEERIASLHAEGVSASAIAALLEAEGVARPTVTSKGWHHSHVLAAVRRVEVRRNANQPTGALR